MLRDILLVEIKLRRTLVFVDFSESRRKQEIKGNLSPRGINDFMRLAMLVNVLPTRISLHTGL